MNGLIIALTCAAFLVAGLIGITLSVPLQAPAVILLGFAAIFAAAQVVKCGSAGVGKFANQELQNSRTTKRQNSKTSIAGLLGLVLVSVGYFVVRACLSPVWDLGVEDLMLIVSAGILYLIAGYAVTGKSGILLRQGLAWVVVVLLLLHVGSCVMQLNGGEGYSAAYYFTGVGRSSPENVTGMYSYYGSFANFAVIAGLLCLSLGVWGRLSVMLRVMMCILGVVALGLALWSQSRSAALSLIPALVVFGVLLLVSLAQHSPRVRRRASKVMVSLGVCGLLAGGVAAAWVFQNRGGASIDEISYSGVRIHYWAMAADQWVDFPIFGAGSRSFSYESFRYWSPNLGTNEANPEFVHNEYLQLMADYGLVGLLLILGLLAWHFYRGGKQVHVLAGKVGAGGLKRGSNAMALAIAGMCGMTAVAVHICFDFRTHLLANLLLLVCCAVWILPVAKSRVLKSVSRGVLKSKKDGRGESDVIQRMAPLSLTGTFIPAKGVNSGGESRIGSWCLGLVLMVLGLGAIGFGGQQLWAGLPLIENKMAKEDGAWVPQNVDRDVWIPVLEESLHRAPQWRRYQRLGTLYRLEASSEGSKADQERALEKAEAAYLASIERHSDNPIPRINLAAVYAGQKMWKSSATMYASASEMAKAREWWFRLPVLWSEMHRQWAGELWKRGDVTRAEEQYLRALEVIQTAKVDNGDATTMYLMIIIELARMYDSCKNFSAADDLFTRAEKKLPNYSINSLNQNIRREMGEHYLRKGKHLWMQRKSEEAYQTLLLAKRSYHIHQVRLKGRPDPIWRNGYDEVKEILAFFKTTGLAK